MSRARFVLMESKPCSISLFYRILFRLTGFHLIAKCSSTLHSPLARPVLAVSIAVFRGNEVLLIQRAKPPAAGLYSLPGGRVERGENLAEAVLRELHEETGLTTRLAGFIDHVEHIERDEAGSIIAHAVICVYAGHWQAGEVTPSDEVADWLWINPQNPPALAMTKNLPAILAKAVQCIGNAG